MKKKYQALRTISAIYRYGAMLLMIGFVIFGALGSFGYDFRTGQQSFQIGIFLGILATGLVTCLGLFAFGQLIQLLIDLEENTRMSAQLLQRMLKRQDN
ncbi:MAG: hypothetical protein ABI690_22865 [Chloroflexota bacterium]